MPNALVLIDFQNQTLARFDCGGVTDVIRFEPGMEFTPYEIEVLRASPAYFKATAGL